jgi:hypothetical protein
MIVLRSLNCRRNSQSPLLKLSAPLRAASSTPKTRLSTRRGAATSASMRLNAAVSTSNTGCEIRVRKIRDRK